MKYQFHEPLNREEDGTYITVGQMRFFLNRPDGNSKFSKAHPDFLRYYNSCRFFNLVSDMIDAGEESAYFYWDEENQEISCDFPSKGVVAEEISKMILYVEDNPELWDEQ